MHRIKKALCLILAVMLCSCGNSSSDTSVSDKENSSSISQSDGVNSDNSSSQGESSTANNSSTGDSSGSEGTGNSSVSDNSGNADGSGNTDNSGSGGNSGGSEGTGSSDNSGNGGFSGGTSNGSGYVNGLSAYTTVYEGTVGTGDYNYGEALQKSLIFYELQRSGDIPDDSRTNWRGDSGMSDGADNGVDLTGGLYDAGDNVKFNLPMAYTSAMLAWSVYEDYDAYEKSGQLEYALDTIRWINDYLIKCHPEENVYYYQVGDGGADHAWWGPAEVMPMNRPSFKVTLDNPGSAVVGEAAASLAACAVVFKDIDPAYSAKCLTHAKQLYSFAETTKSDSGYTAANGFYNSWSGWNDELAWAASWLYTATNDSTWLDKAEQYFKLCGCDPKWTMCWDDVWSGAALRLGMITGDSLYIDKLMANFDYWLNDITYTPKGLAWLDSWGSLRYATTEAFLFAVYSESDLCPDSERQKYWDFAESQINYALGSSGRSYVCGFGENPPQHPHHRTAQGSYNNNMNDPATARHTLFGALVGGPNASDSYNDTVSDYTSNEVACDYNAGYTGVLAKMYARYGGQTLKNFGAVEHVPVNEELTVHAGVNANGDNFTEIKAIVYNKTGWPARTTDKLVLRYFFDISEIIEAGGSASNLSANGNYMQGGALGAITAWDEENNIYFVDVNFIGENISPTSQDNFRREVQFRISSSSVWDPYNDFSFAQVNQQNGSVSLCTSVALYDDGVLVFGSEPDGEPVVVPDRPAGNTGSNTNNNGNNSNNNNQQPAQTTVPGGPAEEGDLKVAITQANSGSSSSIHVALEITNIGNSPIDISDLEIRYYLTKDNSSDFTFFNDHTAIQGASNYISLSGVSARFESASGKDTDSVAKIKISDKQSISSGDILRIQGRICKIDWSAMNSLNDYSASDPSHIVIYSGGKRVFGEEP